MADFKHRSPLGRCQIPIDSGTASRQSHSPPGPINAECDVHYLAADPDHNECPCTGNEKATLVGLKPIPSYTGDFPSPLQIMWYVPETNEALKLHYPDSEIRGWIKEAAEYHGIPHVLLAVILQQENNPNASTTRKVLQFGERSLTTFSAILDKYLWDIVPDFASAGSSGFANMSRAALLNAAEYTEKMYCKNPMPDSVRYRIGGWDQDTRVSGDDLKADLYYAAAHLRQLIDHAMGVQCFDGELTMDDLHRVIASYNGSGSQAQAYADHAIQTLKDAADGKTDLYFYEK